MPLPSPTQKPYRIELYNRTQDCWHLLESYNEDQGDLARDVFADLKGNIVKGRRIRLIQIIEDVTGKE